MTATIPSLLAPIRATLAAATPGPWKNYGDLTHEVYPDRAYGELDEPENIASVVPRLADAAFIASAPVTVARLLAAVEAVVELHYEDIFRGHLSNGCKVCGGDYPCPTVRALTAAIEGAGA